MKEKPAKKLFKVNSLLFLLFIFIITITGCTDEKVVCPHCNGDDDDDQISPMVANISGTLNIKFDSENFSYHSYDFGLYYQREIVAKMYADTLFVEIRLTFNDYSDDKKIYNFADDDANATITFHSIPEEYFQYNVNGTMSLSNYKENEISGTFAFSATTTDEKRKTTVSQGIINFSR